jgi:hypothetical protein
LSGIVTRDSKGGIEDRAYISTDVKMNFEGIARSFSLR